MSPEELQIGSMYEITHSKISYAGVLATESFGEIQVQRSGSVFYNHYKSYREQNNKNMYQWFENDSAGCTLRSRRLSCELFTRDRFMLLGTGTIVSDYSGILTYLRVLIRGTHDCYIRLGYLHDRGYDLELLK